MRLSTWRRLSKQLLANGANGANGAPLIKTYSSFLSCIYVYVFNVLKFGEHLDGEKLEKSIKSVVFLK